MIRSICMAALAICAFGASASAAPERQGPFAGTERPPFTNFEKDAEKGDVFYVKDARGRDNATFKSEAPLEDIIGSSTNFLRV